MKKLLKTLKQNQQENPKYAKVLSAKKYLTLKEVLKWKIKSFKTLHVFYFGDDKLKSFKFKYLGIVYDPKLKVYLIHGQSKWTFNEPLTSDTSSLVFFTLSSDYSPILIKK